MSAFTRALPTVAGLCVLASCSGDDGNQLVLNRRPDFLKSTIVSTTYDGTTNDLLTGGLGKSGLAGAAPQPAIPTSPTVAELRTLAIYSNYRALVDITAAGGYGRLYGPNVDVNGTPTSSDGKIAGEEHLAYADDGSNAQNVTLMVQIPTTLNPEAACIVSATSSGSRGVYGAIATAGEWGLKHGCAVAYADKGTGNGAHDLAANAVNNMLGTRVSAASAGTESQFTASLSGADLAAFNASFPNRWAFKHAHSQQNPEKDWGRDTLRAIRFAFYMLNQKFGSVSGVSYQKINPANTIVIASSASNGAG
ncbi:MAG TPA: 3-hydroxybutyrate oligomer hydrolase family protein, partial [Usitatibacter sp.]|nr:3-hydroxybutyrate oligomer hydrolase family protein [Usitatibacter sp.]